MPDIIYLGAIVLQKPKSKILHDFRQLFHTYNVYPQKITFNFEKHFKRNVNFSLFFVCLFLCFIFVFSGARISHSFIPILYSSIPFDPFHVNLFFHLPSSPRPSSFLPIPLSPPTLTYPSPAQSFPLTKKKIKSFMKEDQISSLGKDSSGIVEQSSKATIGNADLFVNEGKDEVGVLILDDWRRGLRKPILEPLGEEKNDFVRI